MIRNKEEIQKKLDGLCDEMVKIALEDQIISSDEKAIIDSIKSNLTNIENQLSQILESDLDDDEFRDLATQILHDTVKNATNIAKSDKIITADEQKLLDKLNLFVNSGGLFN